MTLISLTPLDPFDHLSEPLQAAWRWKDAWEVIGGGMPTYPDSLSSLGWESWFEFSQALKTYRTHDEHDRLLEATELLSQWQETAQEEALSKQLLRSTLSWCFSAYSDWDPDNGFLLLIWPTEAPWFEFEALDMPIPLYEEMEGAWSFGNSEASEEEEIIATWQQMTEWGFHFCENTQADPQHLHYNAAGPNETKALHQRVMDVLSGPTMAPKKLKH